MNREKALKKLLHIVEQTGDALFAKSDKETIEMNENIQADEVLGKETKKESRLFSAFSKRAVKPLYKLDFGVAAKLFLAASLTAPIVIWNVKSHMDDMHEKWKESIENISSFDSYSTKGDEELLRRADKLIEQLKNKKAQEIIKKATGRDLMVIGDKEALALLGDIPDNVESIISKFDKDEAAFFFARDEKGYIYVVSITPQKTSVYAIEEDGGLRPLNDLGKDMKTKKESKRGFGRSGI